MKKTLSLLVCATMGLFSVGWADNSPELLPVAVTATTGRSVLIDRGRSSGIAPGQRARFFPPGQGEIEGYIQNVSTDSARVELPPNTPLPPVGSKGEVELPPERIGPNGNEKNAGGTTEETIEHPPWSRELEVRGPDDPLLAPGYRMQAKDRKPSIDGRIFTQLNYTFDRGAGRESDFYLGRVGISGTATNLLHKGGRLQFAGEGNMRGVRLDVGEDRSELRFRADRFSYAAGGYEYSAYRAEVGRFYSQYLPELGLVDGLEGALQFQNGISAGIGLGAYPLPSTERDPGDDLGFHAFVQYESDAEHALRAIVAYQKTWHRGNADRDLVVARLNIHPLETLWLNGYVKADIHTSDDTLEGSNVELSEASIQARFVPDQKKGATLSYSHYSWPQLKRDEFQGLPDALISDGHVDRGSIYSWYKVTEDVRVSARGNVWLDQDAVGGGGELGANWTDIADHGTSLYGSVSYTNAAFSNGIGLRSEVRQQFKSIDLFAGYQIFRYRRDALVSGSTNFLRHTVRAGVNWFHGNWYNSLSSDYYLGDGENAISIMLFTEFRF